MRIQIYLSCNEAKNTSEGNSWGCVLSPRILCAFRVGLVYTQGQDRLAFNLQLCNTIVLQPLVLCQAKRAKAEKTSNPLVSDTNTYAGGSLHCSRIKCQLFVKYSAQIFLFLYHFTSY